LIDYARSEVQRSARDALRRYVAAAYAALIAARRATMMLRRARFTSAMMVHFIRAFVVAAAAFCAPPVAMLPLRCASAMLTPDATLSMPSDYCLLRLIRRAMLFRCLMLMSMLLLIFAHFTPDCLMADAFSPFRDTLRC